MPRLDLPREILMRDIEFSGGSVDHFLNRPERRSGGWLVWFVFIGGAFALGGFLGLLAFTYGLI